MLFVPSYERTASLWKFASDSTWLPAHHVTFNGHTRDVYGGAFLGDESYVITGSDDKTLRIWRTSDGMQTANYECGSSVRVSNVSFSAHFLFR